RLRQILVNLIGNAIKFTSVGEVVIEAVTEYERDGQIAVRFNIRDTGIGIPQDKVPLLFDSFQQVDASTSRKFGGSGLGLAISKRLVELMNGRIGVESMEGKGSNFWFTAVFDKGSQPDRGEMPPFADISGVRILAVDDNAVNRIVIAEQMKSWGVRHAEAEGALKAMEMLHAAQAEGDPFRVVVTDMQMPGMDGEALARAIKTDPVLRDTLLVMLTSSGMRGDSKRLASLGFSAYLTKPVRMFQLHNCIAAVLGGSSLHEKAQETAIITGHRLREIARRNVRILLVEDNKVNKMVAVGILDKLGFIADTADNGRQAVNMLEAASYDIVFMDVQMPVMDGFEATRAIRHIEIDSGCHVPIIAMTANAMKGDREKCLKVGMDDYISKPISPQELAKALEKWLPQGQVKLPAVTDMTHDKTTAVVQEALPVFDYAGLLERIMDDKGLAGTIVTAFMEEIPRMLDDLREQIVRGDAGLAGRQAHKIKGSAANTGCVAMSAIAADMQKAGEQGEMETLITLMSELESQLALLKAKIKDSGVLDA
ncbi:MAG: response regulator, partial [Dissulfurispiraceae bacterium]